MFTLWTILSLAGAALAVWTSITLLAQSLPPADGEAAPASDDTLWNGAQRSLPVAVALAVVLLFLGGSESGLGWRAAMACALGAFAATGAVQFGVHCKARMQAKAALRPVLGGIVAGFGLGGVAALLLLFGPGGGQGALGLGLGAALVCTFARSGGTAAVLADLLQSYTGAILAAVLVGAATAGAAEGGQLARLTTYPLIAAAAGIGACQLGARLAQAGRLRLGSRHGERIAALTLLLGSMALLTWWLAPQPLPIGGSEAVSAWCVYLALLIGVLLGPLLGRIAEQSSSPLMAPAQELAQHSHDGAVANLVHGLATGMASTWLPVLVLALAAWGSSELAGHYGICITAVGMVSTLPTSPALAILEPAVAAADRRARASSAAAVTTLAWFAVFLVQSRKDLDLRDANVVTGLLLGGMLPFLLAALLLRARAMALPVASLRRMLAPGTLALATPILTGMVFGCTAVGALLLGAFAAGIVLTLFLASTAGAWAGARDYVETGHVGGKDGPAHAAAALGTAVGQRLLDLPLHATVLLLAIAAVLALPLFR